MRSLQRWRAAPLALGLWLGPLSPLAAREPFELSWHAPAECPGRDEVSAALARLAGAGSRLDDASVEIVRSEEGRWQATLSARGAQRRLEGESCAAVVEALTVVLALAAEQAEAPLAPATPAPAAPLPSASPVPADEQRPDAAAPAHDSAVSPSVRRGWLRWALWVGLWGEIGMLPGPSWGPRAALEFTRGRWSVELALAGLLPRHAELSGAGSPASDLHWLGGQLGLCQRRGLRLSACVGAEAGRLSGTGSGVDEPIDADGGWLAGTAAARWRGPMYERATLSWQLGLGLAAALVRPKFGFDGLGVLHRPSPISGRLFLGLGWQ